MASTVLTGLQLGAASGFVLSIALGILLWVRLQRAGGLELGLAHVVANPERRRGFIWTVGVSFGAFVAAGLIDSLSDVLGFRTAADFAVALLLLTGGVGLLVLIASTLRPTTLSLMEEWNLAESAARASTHSPEPEPSGPPK